MAVEAVRADVDPRGQQLDNARPCLPGTDLASMVLLSHSRGEVGVNAKTTKPPPAARAAFRWCRTLGRRKLDKTHLWEGIVRNGRPPTPLHLRKLRGNPSGKPLDLPEQVPSRGHLGEAPDWFDEDQRSVWKDLQAAAPYGLLTLGDMPLVAAYSVAVALHRQAVIAMRESGGAVIRTKDGNLVQSPWLAIQNRQALIALKCASEMGLTPVSRAVLAARMREAGGSFPAAREENALDEYLREKPDKLDPN